MAASRRILAVAILVAPGACAREPALPLPVVDLPVAVTSLQHVPAGADAVVVTVTADGRVFADGRTWSLARLRRHLESSAGARVARLRIDRAVPWAHVQWLVFTLASAGIGTLRLAYAPERDLACRASVFDVGSDVIYCPEPEGRAVRLRVAGGAGGILHCGGERATDPSVVGEWYARALEEAHRTGLGLVAEILPQGEAPWGLVAEVYERLRAAGADRLLFSGYLAPPPEAREAARLPPPSGDVAPAAYLGIQVGTSWPEDGGPEFGRRASSAGYVGYEHPEPGPRNPAIPPTPLDPEAYGAGR